MKVKETIDIHQRLTVTLTTYGGHVLIDLVESSPENGMPLPRSVTLPLWELAKVFGPHTKTSARPCFTHVQFERNESEREHDLAAMVESATVSEVRMGRSLDELRRAVGISNVDEWLADHPELRPDHPGFWWLINAVVEVVDRDEQLMYRMRNGHLRSVDDIVGWRGHACVDPRIKKKGIDSEGIPF